MILFSDYQKEIINKYFSNNKYKDIPTADVIFKMTKVNDILEAISDLQVEIGFADDFEINDDGRVLEHLYDDIFYNMGEDTQ